MPNTVSIVIMCVTAVECFIVSAGNFFTIIVFWKNRNSLKRTSFLLINIAVADLLVGLTEPIAIATYKISSEHQFEDQMFITAIETTFAFASIFFLVLISMERAYALIWPLHHRAASTKSYIYSALFVWLAGMSVGGLSLLVFYDILNLTHWIVALCAVVVLALIIVCVSYLAIRAKLNCRVPAIGAAHNNENVHHNQSKKLSRTLFVVIAASLVFWLPGTVVICIFILCSGCLPAFLLYISTMLQLTNSLVNPIIYSFRIPMFKETLKRMKLSKKSKEYRVYYRP